MSNKKKLELTLAIIKPHIIKQPHTLQGIRDKIIENHFKIIRSKQICLTLGQAAKFYQEHHKKFFYNRLITFMTSGPSEFYIMTKLNAITEWRQLMGPTKVFRAQFTHPASIRGTYGISDTRNATHGSDSSESATREITLFFPDFNINFWFQNEEIYYRENRLKFLPNDFCHIPVL